MALKAVLREEGKVQKFIEYYRTIPYLDVSMYPIKMINGVIENVLKDGVDAVDALNILQSMYDSLRAELDQNNPTNTTNATNFCKCVLENVRQNPSFPNDGMADKVFEILNEKGFIKPGTSLDEFIEALMESDFMVGAHTAAMKTFGINVHTHSNL